MIDDDLLIALYRNAYKRAAPGGSKDGAKRGSLTKHLAGLRAVRDAVIAAQPSAADSGAKK